VKPTLNGPIIFLLPFLFTHVVIQLQCHTFNIELMLHRDNAVLETTEDGIMILVASPNTSGCIPFHGPNPFPEKLGPRGDGCIWFGLAIDSLSFPLTPRCESMLDIFIISARHGCKNTNQRSTLASAYDMLNVISEASNNFSHFHLILKDRKWKVQATSDSRIRPACLYQRTNGNAALLLQRQTL
jgi:hypothetical protein